VEALALELAEAGGAQEDALQRRVDAEAEVEKLSERVAALSAQAIAASAEAGVLEASADDLRLQVGGALFKIFHDVYVDICVYVVS
jgi:hypothetical protein